MIIIVIDVFNNIDVFKRYLKTFLFAQY